MIIERKIYSGELLQDRFAYDFFKDRVSRIGNIIAFRAPMKVEADFMVDKEDLAENDFIYSDDAINFLIEIPSIDLFGGVCFQRLFNSHLATILSSEYLKVPIEIDGDDIMVPLPLLANQSETERKRGKASVSIAKQCNNAVLIHTGINVVAGDKAPDFAYSTKLTDDQAIDFMKKGCELFYMMAHDVFVATCKIVK